MSIVKEKRRKKDKHPRNRSMKVLRRRRIKRNIYKSRGWKLNYPKVFKEIEYYPFIVKK